MKRVMIAGILFLAAVLAFSFPAAGRDISVPEIEKWQLIDQWDWKMGNEESGYFRIGEHKVYQNPADPDMFGSVLSFVGSEEAVLKAWWKGKKENLKEGKELIVAVKNEDGEWIIARNDRGLAFLPDIQDGKMVSLVIVLAPPKDQQSGALEVLRVVTFNPPLSPQK